MFLYQILASTIHGKEQKSRTKAMDLKYHLRRGVMSLNYFMDYILMDMLDIEDYFKYIFKNYETATDNPIRVYVHKK